jgi:predicted nucleic acid-binding protein
MKLYLDSNTIIYCLEGAAEVQRLFITRISEVEAMGGGSLITSRLAWLECRVKPLRDGDRELVARYSAFFNRAQFRVAEIDAKVIEAATDLRVRYGFRTPDAIHLGTAMVQEANLFLTGDKALAKCQEVPVEVVSPRERKA